VPFGKAKPAPASTSEASRRRAPAWVVRTWRLLALVCCTVLFGLWLSSTEAAEKTPRDLAPGSDWTLGLTRLSQNVRPAYLTEARLGDAAGVHRRFPSPR